MPGVTEAARGRPGSITAPRGGAQGDVPSLLVIDRPPDKVRDFISLRVCCDLLKDGAARPPPLPPASGGASMAAGCFYC